MKAAKSFKTQEEINWPGKKSEKKENRTKRVDGPFQSYINTVVEKHLIRNYTC